MNKLLYALIVIVLMLYSCGQKESNELKLAAGIGTAGFKDGNPGEMNKPIRLAPYTDSSVVFADINNHAIRIASIYGDVTTIAGGPDKEGYLDGLASEAKFKSPHGVAYEKKTNKIYVAEAGNHTIREIYRDDSGYLQVKTLAGVAGSAGFKDGPSDSAKFISPHAVVIDTDGGIVVADIGNAKVRMIKDGEVSTLAGSGDSEIRDGKPSEASFKYIMDIVPFEKNIYLADAGVHQVRQIKPNVEVTTLELSDTLNTPHGIAVDEEQNIYIADMGTHRILKIDNDGKVEAIAGTGKEGSNLLELNKPAAVLVHAGYLWIADLNNHQIKVLELEN